MKPTFRILAIAVLLWVPTAAFAPEDPGEFVPTEEISADNAIELPVDI
jgi:hypothetical protein